MDWLRVRTLASTLALTSGSIGIFVAVVASMPVLLAEALGILILIVALVLCSAVGCATPRRDGDTAL